MRIKKVFTQKLSKIYLIVYIFNCFSPLDSQSIYHAMTKFICTKKTNEEIKENKITIVHNKIFT